MQKSPAGNFFQNLIYEKVPSLRQKMMIFHKISRSGVYENVFRISENYSSDGIIAVQSIKK